MRVVYVSTIERGGPLTHLRQLVPRVAAQGVDVEVLCGSEELAESFRRLDVPARAVEVAHKLDVRGAASLLPLLEGADVVHIHGHRLKRPADTGTKYPGPPRIKIWAVPLN